MIKEAYCSFEVAKLLKEKGFECEKKSISAIYNELGVFHSLSTANDEYYDYEDFDKYDYIAPTLQMATAWLRETHGIYIVFFHTNKSGWWYNITDMRDSYVFYSSEKMMCSYEEACEAAIKYSLKNLI